MDNEQYNSTFELLTQILNQSGLDWVVQQVEEQIRFGQIQEKEVDTLKVNHKRLDEQTSFSFSEQHLQHFKKGSKAIFPVMEEYSPKERLVLLIDAIEHVVVNIMEMELYLFNSLNNEIKEIHFYSEEHESLAIRINKEDVASRVEHGRLLRSLLNELRTFVIRA